MIIINDKSKVKTVYAPRPIQSDDITLVLKCTGETDKKQYLTVVYDKDDFETNLTDYYCFDFYAPTWPIQEYKYEIYTTDNKFLGSGLLKITDSENCSGTDSGPIKTYKNRL